MSVNDKNVYNAPEEIITATTDAFTSEEITNRGTMTFFCDPLQALETVTLQIKKPDGTFINCIMNSRPIQLSTISNAEGIYARGTYRFVKTTTISSVGVYCYISEF